MIYNPKEFKLEKTTIWSFEERGKWATHRGDYRGNCPPQVPRNLILKYTKENDIVLDPFCGSGTSMIECKLLNRKGIGIDVNVEALKLAQSRINFEYTTSYEPKLIKGDSTNLQSIIPNEKIDFIFAHPPYADIIKYSKDIKEDISRLNLQEFLNQMSLFSKECFRILKKDKICSILIGDIRKNKKNVNDLIIQQIKCINEIYFKDAIDDIIKQNKIDILYARHEVLEKRLKRVDLIYEILYGIMISMIAALAYWLITECGIEGIYIGCGVVILLSLIIFGIKMSRKGIDNSYANMVDKYELCILDKKIYECEKGFIAH